MISSLFLAGCGGSSSDEDGNNSPPPTSSSTGVFIDSAVSGIPYKTATFNDITSADGEYQYAAGETVTFSIGGVNFPPVAAKAVVTPFDMSSSETTQFNIGLLLQSLDEDKNPSNGINITPATLTTFKDLALASTDFDELDTDSFKNKFASIESLNEDSKWERVKDVKAHLANASGYVGTWLLATSGADGRVFFKMTADGQYLLLSDQKSSETIKDVVQTGTYSFDTETSEITLTKTVGDDDFMVGVGPQSGLAYELRFANDLSSFELVFNENDAPKFNRIVKLADEVKAADPLYGIWKFKDSGSEISVANKFISFNKDNSYTEFSMDVLFYEKGIYEIVGEALIIDSVTETTDGTKGISNEIDPRFSIDASGVMTVTVFDSYLKKDVTVTLTKMLPF